MCVYGGDNKECKKDNMNSKEIKESYMPVFKRKGRVCVCNII